MVPVMVYGFTQTDFPPKLYFLAMYNVGLMLLFKRPIAAFIWILDNIYI